MIANIPNKPAEWNLGNLYFGGVVIMQTTHELVIETPAELFIRIPFPKENVTGKLPDYLTKNPTHKDLPASLDKI